MGVTALVTRTVNTINSLFSVSINVDEHIGEKHEAEDVVVILCILVFALGFLVCKSTT